MEHQQQQELPNPLPSSSSMDHEQKERKRAKGAREVFRKWSIFLSMDTCTMLPWGLAFLSSSLSLSLSLSLSHALQGASRQKPRRGEPVQYSTASALMCT